MLWIAAEYPGGSNHRAAGIGGEISREKAVGWKVAGVIAAVEIPGDARKATPGNGPGACRNYILGGHRYWARSCQNAGGSNQNPELAHGMVLNCSRDDFFPNRLSSPRAGRAGIANRARRFGPTKRRPSYWAGRGRAPRRDDREHSSGLFPAPARLRRHSCRMTRACCSPPPLSSVAQAQAKAPTLQAQPAGPPPTQKSSFSWPVPQRGSIRRRAGLLFNSDFAAAARRAFRPVSIRRRVPGTDCWPPTAWSVEPAPG